MKTDLPQYLKEGYRLIMLTQRAKEGGKVNKPDRVARHRKLSKSPEEFDAIIAEFSAILHSVEDPLRIYSSVNARNIEKGIREFKMRQLEADYYDPETRLGFYIDLKNRWISCVMQPSSRSETRFLIDCDTKEEAFQAKEALSEKGLFPLFEYPTKQGTHLITMPFNPTNFPVEVKKDGLLLIEWKD